MNTQLSKNRLSARAIEYFGGDVQRFTFEAEDAGAAYCIRQIPHWGNARTAARVYAESARAAAVQLNRIARFAETQFA